MASTTKRPASRSKRKSRPWPLTVCPAEEVAGHAGSGDLLDEPFTVKAIDDYARSLGELVDPEWGKNDQRL